MAREGWKIATLILGMTTVGGIVGTFANRNALAEAERQLANALNYTPPQTVTVDRVIRAPCPTTVDTTPNELNTNECRGGVVLKKTKNGWESVLYGGRPVRCE